MVADTILIYDVSFVFVFLGRRLASERSRVFSCFFFCCLFRPSINAHFFCMSRPYRCCTRHILSTVLCYRARSLWFAFLRIVISESVFNIRHLFVLTCSRVSLLSRRRKCLTLVFITIIILRVGHILAVRDALMRVGILFMSPSLMAIIQYFIILSFFCLALSVPKHKDYFLYHSNTVHLCIQSFDVLPFFGYYRISIRYIPCIHFSSELFRYLLFHALITSRPSWKKNFMRTNYTYQIFKTNCLCFFKIFLGCFSFFFLTICFFLYWTKSRTKSVLAVLT